MPVFWRSYTQAELFHPVKNRKSWGFAVLTEGICVRDTSGAIGASQDVSPNGASRKVCPVFYMAASSFLRRVTRSIGSRL